MLSSVILLALTGAFKGASNFLLFRITPESRLYLHPFWDPDVSWKNKWKNGNHEEGPRFLGSTTIFVALTDGWHLMEFLQWACIQSMASIWFDLNYWGAIPDFLAVYFVAWAIRSLAFKIVYE